MQIFQVTYSFLRIAIIKQYMAQININQVAKNHNKNLKINHDSIRILQHKRALWIAIKTKLSFP